MDNTTYPGSDTDVNETYENCDFHSMASNELDFVDHWVNSTVEKEVLRGSKLREEKLRSYPQQEEYKISNINLVRSPCVEINTSYYSFRKSSHPRAKVKTGSCSRRSNSPFLRRSSSSRVYTPQMTHSRPNTPIFKSKYGRNCPMRIAELAVPTKRQCIDTWRNKYDVLPAFMVERLRQQVMDEKPVVQIKEAITCFKGRKPRSIGSIKRSKNVNRGRDSKLKNERIVEIRNLCAAFAQKIGQRLITPQNLKLTPELENISKIVACELTKITRNRKKYDLDMVTSNRIQAEIAEKITVWIATILEETSYKILEEDLRVKKQIERQDVKEERLVTLIENLVHQDKPTELEEEEGPVLDFIDALVDNVVIICEPQGNVQENDNISETTSKPYGEEINGNIMSPDSIETNEFDTSTLYTNITYGTGDVSVTINKQDNVSTELIQGIDDKSLDQSSFVESTDTNINDHIRGEIVKIVDSVIPDDHDNKIEVNNVSSDKYIDYEIKDALGNETDITEKHQDLQKSPGNSELTAQLKEIQSDLELALTDDVVISSKNSLEDAKDDPHSNAQNIKADEDNVIDALDGESLDDKDKKVKFSEVEMDVGGTAEQLDSNSAAESTEQNIHERERVSWHSSTDIHEIVFAPPNEHLLSDADESWPDDITLPVLKPSASVCRSITSLGKILEKDEKDLLLQDGTQWEAHQNELEILNHTDVNNSRTEAQLKNIQKPNEQEAQIAIEKDESQIDSTNQKNPEYVTDETASSLYTIKTCEAKTVTDKPVVLLEPDTEGLILDSSTSPFKITIIDDISIKNQETIKEKPLTENDIKNVESDTNVIYEAVQQKMRSSYAISEPKHDYKVHAKTAPSWLRHDHGKGEPSEDSFRGSKSREKLKESDIRNWCQDLDRMFVNLESWNNWINNTCKNIMHLKQKKGTKRLFVPNVRKSDARDWTILKKNIDKDSVLWTKLNQRAYERLRTYKDRGKYQQPAKSEIMNINHDNYETVLKSLQEIDSICLWMHRTIVSTEYCMLCDCKNNFKRKD